MGEKVGEWYLDDIMHSAKFQSVQLTDTMLSHQSTGAALRDEQCCILRNFCQDGRRRPSEILAENKSQYTYIHTYKLTRTCIFLFDSFKNF